MTQNSCLPAVTLFFVPKRCSREQKALSILKTAEIIHPPHRWGISRCWLDSMIIAQVCLKLAKIKGHSEMCSFISQHNATSFEGACNWHADCRNVHQSCCPSIECSFLCYKPPPKAFQRIWQYIQPASKPQTTCNHTSSGPPHPASSPPRLSETSHQLLQQSVCITKAFLHKLSETISGNLILHACRPHRGVGLTAVRRRNWLEWANAHIRWHLAL